MRNVGITIIIIAGLLAGCTQSSGVATSVSDAEVSYGDALSQRARHGSPIRGGK